MSLSTAALLAIYAAILDSIEPGGEINDAALEALALLFDQTLVQALAVVDRGGVWVHVTPSSLQTQTQRDGGGVGTSLRGGGSLPTIATVQASSHPGEGAYRVVLPPLPLPPPQAQARPQAHVQAQPPNQDPASDPPSPPPSSPSPPTMAPTTRPAQHEGGLAQEAHEGWCPCPTFTLLHGGMQGQAYTGLPLPICVHLLAGAIALRTGRCRFLLQGDRGGGGAASDRQQVPAPSRRGTCDHGQGDGINGDSVQADRADGDSDLDLDTYFTNLLAPFSPS